MEEFHLSERPSVARAIEAAAKCQTLPELYDAIANYDASEIAKNGHNTPSQIALRPDGAANSQGPIMIVSEKPEDEDAAEGRPFSGEYGGVMRNAIRDAQVDLGACHVAYAIRWMTPDGKTPNKTQIAASRPFLYREIELVKPRAILAQGKGVLESLSGYRGNILEVAGQSMQFKRGDMVIPMFIHTHPKYCLFNGTHFVDFRQNLTEFFSQHGDAEEETLPGTHSEMYPVAGHEDGYEPIFKRVEDMRRQAA